MYTQHGKFLLVLLSVSCVRETKPRPLSVAPPGDEQCDDGADNDQDGLVDCEDGDCMDFLDCVHAGATIAVQLTGGGPLTFEREFERPAWKSWIDIEVEDLQGSVRIYGADGGTTSCEWTLESAHGQMSWTPYEVRTEIVGDPTWTRTGLEIEDGCQLSTDQLFPNLLIGLESFTTMDGSPWYLGSVINYSLDSTDYYSAPAYSRVVGWALEHWEYDDLEPSGTWTFAVK
jgi:hypothetical protein